MKNYNCKLCNRKYIKVYTLVAHLNKEHNIILEEYYSKYLSNENEGKCKICKNKTEFISFGKGYKNNCSMSCQNKYKQIKTLEALKEKYGVINASQLPRHREKVRKTNLKNHGVENWVNPDKMKQTNLERYGRISYTGTEEYNKKYEKTVLKRFGVKHHTQSQEVKDKSKKTCKDRYGVEYSLQVPEIRLRIEETVKEKYGGFTLASKELSDKVKKTMLKRYGVDCAGKSSEIRKKIEDTNLKRYGVKCVLQNKKHNLKLFGVEDINDIQEVKEKQKKNRQKTLKEKYNVENISQLKQTQDTIKSNNLKKYGVESTSQLESTKKKIAQTHFERFGEYSKFLPGFSLSSQELFRLLEKKILKKYKNIDIYYATNKNDVKTNEYRVLTEGSIKYLDFYIPKLNKWIEFDEPFHKRQQKVDLIREQKIFETMPDIDLLRINEVDYVNNSKKIIKQCLNFILG